MSVLKGTLFLLCLGSFTFTYGSLLHPSNTHQLQALSIQNNGPIGSSIVKQNNGSDAVSSTDSSRSGNTHVTPEPNIHGNASTFDIQELLKNLSLFGETKNSSSGGDGNSEILLNPSVGNTSMQYQPQNSNIFAGNVAKLIQDIYDKIATIMTTNQENGHLVAGSNGYVHSGGHAIGPDKVVSEDSANANANALYQKLISLCQQQCRSGPCPNSCPQAYLGAWSRLLRSVRATKETWSRIRGLYLP